MTAKERSYKMLEEWASMKVADLPEFFERHLREHANESLARFQRVVLGSGRHDWEHQERSVFGYKEMKKEFEERLLAKIDSGDMRPKDC